jgi:flagellar protein FliO/FliZ
MFDYLVALSPSAKFFISFAIVLALIGLTAWLVRRFGANRLGGANARGRQPRLAVIDSAAVDGRRRLVLIRRDNIEHLLMIGGQTDVVIEPNIARAAEAREAMREPVRPEPSMRAVAPVDPARPLRPSHEPSLVAPAPPSYRAPAIDAPWLPLEPGAYPRPSDTLSGLAAELSTRLKPPDLAPPTAVRHEPRQDLRQEPPAYVAPPPPPEPPPSTYNDHNLTEMAQQLEAALRRAPKGRPPVTDPLAEPAAGHTPSRPEAPHAELKFDARFESEVDDKPELKFEPKEEPRPQLAARAESKPELAPAAPKKLHDNLEEEMANLLGRPPRKS